MSGNCPHIYTGRLRESFLQSTEPLVDVGWHNSISSDRRGRGKATKGWIERGRIANVRQTPRLSDLFVREWFVDTSAEAGRPLDFQVD